MNEEYKNRNQNEHLAISNNLPVSFFYNINTGLALPIVAIPTAFPLTLPDPLFDSSFNEVLEKQVPCK